MVRVHIRKTELARRMNTSGPAVDRLFEQANRSVTRSLKGTFIPIRPLTNADVASPNRGSESVGAAPPMPTSCRRDASSRPNTADYG